jgi:CubicO group peptidase (beta-lactamase class C family)
MRSHRAIIFAVLLSSVGPGWAVAQSAVPHTPTVPVLPASPFPVVSPEDVGVPSDQVRGLVDRVEGWVEGGEIVGAEMLIVKDRKIILHETVGWSDREEGLALERNSIYRIRSMTKPFTGTSIFLLVEDGELSLDDRVATYLPSWRNEASRDITIRQLLSHSGGFIQGGFPRPFQSFRSLREAVDAVGSAGPQNPVGERYEYSDVGSATLGAIVEEVSGIPVEEFIQNRILDPLGLSDTHTGFSPGLPWAPRMNPTYSRTSGDAPWVKYWHPSQEQAFPFFRASGGLYTTILDYARWLTVICDLGEYPEGRLLSEEAVEAALQPAASRGYGLHWEVFSAAPEDDGIPAFGHGGSDGTLAAAIPAWDTQVLIFTQSRGNRVIRGFLMNAQSVLDPGPQGEGR